MKPIPAVPTQRPSTATPDGQWKTPEITGLFFRRLTPMEDERGDLTELFRADWGFHPDPVVQVYRVTVRPGAIKAWSLHKLQDDRIVIIDGTLRWAFYDARLESPTLGNLLVRTFSERNRHLFVIPSGVWHGVENVGTNDAAFINFPTMLYNHESPDRYWLPVENSLIPFAFGPTPGLPASR